ncbi:UNVERIFIED_CONTAM: hypothetical protein HDU68_003234 [Siphonaria sp. JEL0065]|nr:hypothetical protein HDU68_003234 [Siphonaria sp. JEL0065]
MTSMDDSGSIRYSTTNSVAGSDVSSASARIIPMPGEKKRITAAMLNLLKSEGLGGHKPEVRVSVSETGSATAGSNNNSQERLQTTRSSELSIELPRANSASASATASNLALNDLRKEFLSGPMLVGATVKPGEYQPPPGNRPRSPLRSILKPDLSSGSPKVTSTGQLGGGGQTVGIVRSSDSLDDNHGPFISRTKVKWDKTRVYTFEPMEDEDAKDTTGPISKNKKRDLMRV